MSLPAPQSSPVPRGLAGEEARRRLDLEGPNELAAQRRRGIAHIALDVLREPMFLLLVAAGALYVVMGAIDDALMLLAAVGAVMAIAIVQQGRSERALDALRELASPRALVVRDGRAQRIPGREVVRGDLVLLAEGDRVPADAVLRDGAGLQVDESLLTGESAPVRKLPSAQLAAAQRPGGEDLATVFAGTLVTAGQGSCEVLATGARTEFGRIGASLHAIDPQPTPLQLETGRIVRALATVGLLASAAVAAAWALTRGNTAQTWNEGLLAGITMAMALLPEEFPVVLAVFLALGAWRISRSRVLTRRLPAIETLGAASVLCVDKTGTLTENRMTLRVVVAGEQRCTLPADGGLAQDCAAVVEVATLASADHDFDPMERALRQTAVGGVGPRPSRRAREYALSPQLAAVSHVWERGPGEDWLVATKGAPEAVAELCRLPLAERAALAARVRALGEQGLRVLGVARGHLPAGALPAGQAELPLHFIGLVAFADPLRADVAAAVAECHQAGLRVVMITGDGPATAQSIAREAGLPRPGALLDGETLARLDDAELAQRIDSIDVFARVVPAQKLRIVEALKARGEIVAMTGDGVNDAPALKAAHIGIAMGGRGSDVAREAGALVLLDDDFGSIVRAVRLGRRIYDNIRKAVAFIIAVHVPIAGLSMLPVLFPDWPLLLLPAHILSLELIIDPACSLVFEAERAEPDVMQRPPRRGDARLFSWPTVLRALLQGLSMLAACVAVFMLARTDHGTDAARALTFAALVTAILATILTNRSRARGAVAMLREPNAALWWVLGGTTAFLAAVLVAPPLQRLFHFAPLTADDLALALLAGIACLAWLEAARLLPARRRAVDPSR